MMPKTKSKDPRSRKGTLALVPKPPPPPPMAVRNLSRGGMHMPHRSSSTVKPGAMKRAKEQVKALQEELESKETKMTHVAAGIGGAVGGTLAGAVVVNRNWMSARWASALLTTVGAGTSFAGWYYDNAHVMWGGAGCAFAGAAHGTMAVVVDARDAAQKKSKQVAAQPRNALPPRHEPQSGERDAELGRFK
jgi:hypothetical protein